MAADRSFPFLQAYPVTLHTLDTGRGQSIDRDGSAFPVVNSNNIQLYRQNGIDNIVTAMQDLTQKKFIDDVQNKYAQAGFKGQVESFHQSIFDPVAIGIATTMLQNSRGGVTREQAFQNLYNAIVLNGLALHFPIGADTQTFNLNAPNLPPGFGTLIKTEITQPPVVPPTTQFKKEYDGFSARDGFNFDSPDAPDIPDSNYGNEYPEQDLTEGDGSATSAQRSIVGQFFDVFINAVGNQNTQLLHSGLTPSGSPITASAFVVVDI